MYESFCAEQSESCRWRMAVKVRIGEKEILQAMKQSVLMLMASCQESEDEEDASGEDDESDEDNKGAV